NFNTDNLREKHFSPRYTRYAAPAHLIRKKRLYEATIKAPRLVADNAKYIAFADKIPRLAQMAFRAPCRIPCDKTNNTAGPGVMLRTASVITNRNQISNLITAGHLRKYHHI